MKSILKFAGLAVAALIAIVFSFADSAFATDVPYGYSIRNVPPAKGEKNRQEVLNKKGEVVSILIDHQDGAMETRTLDADGKLETKHVTGKDGKSSEYSYYPDGKLKLERKGDVRLFQRRKLADGTYEAIRYKEDGKRPQMLRRVGPEGRFELTHYRTDADKVWFKVSIPGTSGEFESEYFAEDGSRVRRVKSDKTMVVTAYNKDGDVWFEQVWNKVDKGTYVLSSLSVPQRDAYLRYVLAKDGKTVESVEEVDPSGKVESTRKPDRVAKPDEKLLQEVFPEDNPTIPDGKDD